MKRCIVVDVRESKDKKTNENLIWVTCYSLAKKTKDGNLWHAKTDEALVYLCINQTKEPERYETFSKVNPGCLVDVNFALNDYNRVVVQSADIVENTNLLPYTILYK